MIDSLPGENRISVIGWSWISVNVIDAHRDIIKSDSDLLSGLCSY